MRCSTCSVTITPVVCVDIDGSLGDYHGHFVNFAESYLGRGLTRGWSGEGDWEKHLGLAKPLYREIKLAYRQGGMKRNMPMRPEALALMKSLRDLSAELWLTTTRPWMRLDSVDPDTREWLSRNRIAYDHLLYDELKYQRVCDIVGSRAVAVIDDIEAECIAADQVFGRSIAIQCEGDYNTGSTFPLKLSLSQAHDVIVDRVSEWWRHNG